jgi:hypothetical protein
MAWPPPKQAKTLIKNGFCSSENGNLFNISRIYNCKYPFRLLKLGIGPQKNLSFPLIFAK